MELVTETLDAVGTVLIAWMAISVHRRVLHEHKVDSRVFRTMKREQALAVLGIGFIVISYFLKIFL